MASSPSLPRRVVLVLARFGLDLRPLVRRLRDAIVRQHRAETVEQFDQLRLVLRTLQQDVVTLNNRVTDNQSTLEGDVIALQTRIASLQQALGDTRADVHEHGVRLDESRALHQRQSVLHEQLSGRLCQFGDRLEQCSLLHDERSYLLEQLLAGTAAARPPGAARVVQCLPDPAVAVILPTYNRADVLGEAVASVQAQRFRSWELIIVDDGSTDDTESVVAPLLADRRIRYVRQARANGSVARNRGIAESGAPLIAYLDSDNLWYPDFLARAVDCLATESEVDFVYGALVTSDHGLRQRCILWVPFDRSLLLTGNFLDTNVMVHRRDLVARFGGWDTDLVRMVDWDIALRFTVEKPARPLAVLAAQYRQCDDQSITLAIPRWPAEVAVRAKWFPPPAPTLRPRVLYVVWHYPQLSESYAETELACMRRWGVHVEVWCTSAGASLYPTDVTIHRGSLAVAIEAARPNIIHVHWLGFANMRRDELAAAGLPVTVRAHGFDTTRDNLAAWLANDFAAAVYAFPGQIARCGIDDDRLRPTPVGFDTRLFKPSLGKDRRLVVRTAAALPSKDLECFFEAARMLPDFRFVLAAVTCQGAEEYADELRTIHERMATPAELLFDVPREDVAALVSRAGIYLHTMHGSGHTAATPVGEPTSIAEAMATGCHCLVRDVAELVAMLGHSGAAYGDLDELVELIHATETWSDSEWHEAWQRGVEQAYQHYADVMVYQAMFSDWMELAEARDLECRVQHGEPSHVEPA
jgi:hypothetical protein